MQVFTRLFLFILFSACTLAQAQELILVQTVGNTFSPRDITISVGDTVVWRNAGGVHNVNGSLETYPDNPAGFLSGNPVAGPVILDTVIFSIPGFYRYQCDPHASIDMLGTVTVVPALNAIGAINTVDPTTGVATALNTEVTVRGIVIGNNIRPGGLQFAITDDNGDAIGVFLGSENFGYNAVEGDEVTVSGSIDQFRGLTQVAVDTIILESQGNAIPDPILVTELGEETESKLIRIENVKIIDPGQWTNNGSGFNVMVMDGMGRTFDMRIDADVELFGTAPPSESFNLSGIGGQFDQEEPFLEGYQVLPRFAADIDLISSTEEPSWASALQFGPNPVVTNLRLQLPAEVDQLRVLDNNGRVVLRRTVTGPVQELNFSRLPAGLYFLEAIGKNGTAVRRVQRQ